MQQISVREMRNELGQLDHLLDVAGEVIVTRRGKPIARVLPIQPEQRARPSHAELRQSMPRLSTSSVELIRQDRNER